MKRVYVYEKCSRFCTNTLHSVQPIRISIFDNQDKFNLPSVKQSWEIKQRVGEV